MTYETVGTPGSDSEYFAEDHDQVYCVHGVFIGYPGGADFICGLCEDGATELEHRMVARLCYTVPEDPDWPYVFSTHYSAAGMQKDNDLVSLLKKEAGKIGTEWYWEFDIESYWVQPE